MSTTIYLIRHADTTGELGIRNTNETSQMTNKLSQNEELKNIDTIWSSSYVRAKQTAKYIASINSLQLNLDDRLNERKLGNLEEIAEFMKDKKTRDVSEVQLIFPKFKTSDGESLEETKKRMLEFILELLDKYKEKRIAVVSHGGSIKFLLLNWCMLNNNKKLEYKGKELNITSPCLLKLIFQDKDLIDLVQIV